LLERTGPDGTKLIHDYDGEFDHMGAQYNITVDDVINLNLFRVTKPARTGEVIDFFDHIRFVHAGPLELLTLAVEKPEYARRATTVGLDFTARNRDVNHRVTFLVTERHGLAARLRNTLQTAMYVPHEAYKKDEGWKYETEWPVGTLFAGIDKNYVDPVEYDD
jgi:hypothetical protein